MAQSAGLRELFLWLFLFQFPSRRRAESRNEKRPGLGPGRLSASFGSESSRLSAR